MTRTDAFMFALKKVLEQHRTYIDGQEVRSIQLTISLNRDGDANVVVSPRTEDTIVGCYEGHSRIEKFSFT